jgi:putative phage-type endonuclease
MTQPENKLTWSEAELPQGSDKWHDFRAAKGEFSHLATEYTLGGSEIACLMHASPFKSIQMLWEDKLGMREKPDFTEIMERGNFYEPVARDLYAASFGVEVEQMCAVHPEKLWMRTSLDGITADRRVILEIKTPKNKANHLKQTAKGKVPTHRYPQMQWQIAVMREHFPQIERVDYVSFLVEDEDPMNENPNVEMKIIPVLPREDYIAEMMRRAEIFVGYLERREYPPINLFREKKGLVISARPEPLPTN